MLPKIRSFVRRQGRLTSGQQQALDTFSNAWCLSLEAHTPFKPEQVFGRQRPMILEIGFGDGQCLLEMAAQMPEYDFMGVEVHRPGVGRLLMGMSQRALENIRIMSADAVQVLEQCIGEEQLAGIHIFFPDPWPKKRHHKRRLIQSEFVRLLVQKLEPGGWIHLATDWENYAEHMLAVLSAEPALENQAAAGEDFSFNTGRPETKFERRGIRLGHGVWDLKFRKKKA